MIRTSSRAISNISKRASRIQREVLSATCMLAHVNDTCTQPIFSTSPFWSTAETASGNGTIKRMYTSTRPHLKTVSITYVEADGTSKTVDAEVGTDLMSAAHDNDIELEGACGGELACSTCHLIFDPDIYDSLPEKEDEEDDMLDLAFEVTDTSRLGCQITVQENFDGMTVQIPDDGF